jgi:hypothetical protein
MNDDPPSQLEPSYSKRISFRFVVKTPPCLFENFVNDHKNDHLGKLKTGQERDFEEQQDFLTFDKYKKRTKNEQRVSTTSSDFKHFSVSWKFTCLFEIFILGSNRKLKMKQWHLKRDKVKNTT